MPPRRRALTEVDANAPSTTAVRGKGASGSVKPSAQPKTKANQKNLQLQAALQQTEQENEDLKAQIANLTAQLSKAKIENAPAQSAPKKNPFGGDFLPTTYRPKTAGLPPARPTSAFQYFCVDFRQEVRAQMPEASPLQVNAHLKVLWGRKNEEEKAEYMQKAAEDKARHETDKAEYEAKLKEVERTNLAVQAMQDELKLKAAMELYEREMEKKATVGPSASENPGVEKPKQPRSAWNFYVKHRREEMKESEERTPTIRELNTQLSEAWNKLQKSKKKADKALLKFIQDQANADRIRFDEEVAAYNARITEQRKKADEEAEQLEKIALQKYAEKESKDAMILEGKRAQAEREKALKEEKKAIREEKRAAREAKAALPKAARSAYQFYMIENRSKIQEEQKGITNKEIMRELGARWKAMSQDDKAPYIELAAEDRIRFEKETNGA